MNTSIIAAFVRTLGLAAPLLGLPGIARLAESGAALIEAGADGARRLGALTAEIKARHDAGITTSAEEILADVDRIKDLDKKIQDTAGPGS